MERTLSQRFLGLFNRSKNLKTKSTRNIARIVQKYYDKDDILTAALLRKHEGYSSPPEEVEFYKLYADDRVTRYLEFLNDRVQQKNQSWLEKNNLHLNEIWMDQVPWQAIVISMAYAIDEIDDLIAKGRNQENPTLAEAVGYYKRYFNVVIGWKEIDHRLFDRLESGIQELNSYL